ncbi:MAG: DIPK family protein [Proteobacteria bacterium]|nr:DIPK family protein [Pseudomonadota bacterium]
MPMDLLSNPPPTVAERLEKLLEECSRPGPSQIDWNLFNELKSLLISSVEEKIVNL